MSEADRDSDNEIATDGDHRPADLVRPERPKLRTRPLGYKRADVDSALETRDAELDELRQDIAALWLAFAQHDRMIRSLGGEASSAPVAPPAPPSDLAVEASPQPTPSSSAIEAEAESIGHQLSELDEVLAAIELATQTLERTYSEEIAKPQADEPENEQGPDAEDAAIVESADTEDSAVVESAQAEGENDPARPEAADRG